MTQTYNEDVEVRGKLQIQEDVTPNTPLTTLTEDGRIEVGDDLGLATPESLIEAHRAETSLSKPKRGIHSLGQIGGAISDVISWVFAELELPGTGAISGVHQALRARLIHNNADDSSQAELRAGEFEVVNQSGTSGTPVGQAIGIRAGVTTEAVGHLDKAVGVEVELNNSGSVNEAVGLEVADVTGATDSYAIRTGLGKIRFGDLGTGIVQADANGELNSDSISPSSLPSMIGADAGNNGMGGIVPSPSAGDEAKYLAGDATWKVIPSTAIELITYHRVTTPNSTISLSNLGLTNYRKVVGYIRFRDKNSNSNSALLHMRFDGDTTNGNYFCLSLYHHNTATSPTLVYNNGAIGRLCNSYATNPFFTSNFAFYEFQLIPANPDDYVTHMVGHGGAPFNSSTYRHEDYSLYYQGASVPSLDSMQFTLVVSGPTPEFAIGTEIALYGYK